MVFLPARCRNLKGADISSRNWMPIIYEAVTSFVIKLLVAGFVKIICLYHSEGNEIWIFLQESAESEILVQPADCSSGLSQSEAKGLNPKLQCGYLSDDAITLGDQKHNVAIICTDLVSYGILPLPAFLQFLYEQSKIFCQFRL